MAASEPVYSVKLTIDDVPGAKFKYTTINEHSVIELKRWLECRGLPISGNKDELVKRYACSMFRLCLHCHFTFAYSLLCC